MRANIILIQTGCTKLLQQ